MKDKTQVIVNITIIVLIILLGVFSYNRFDKLDNRTEEVLDYTYHLYNDMQGDYQITIVRDTIFIMDKSREVGRFKLEYDKDPLGTMITEDNQ